MHRKHSAHAKSKTKDIVLLHRDRARIVSRAVRDSFNDFFHIGAVVHPTARSRNAVKAFTTAVRRKLRRMELQTRLG